MKLNLNSNRLSLAVKSTGAKIKPRELKNQNIREILDFSSSSLTTSGSLKIDISEQPLINSYGGLIYFQDLWVVITSNLSSIRKGGLFHITNCEDCCDIIKKDKFEIFPVLKFYSTRAKLLEAIVKYELQACPKCLRQVDWDGFRDAEYWARQPVLERFNIQQYFETADSFEIERTFNLVSDNFLKKLPDDHLRMLQKLKKKANWKCGTCNLNFSGYKSMFHIVPDEDNAKKYKASLEYGKKSCLQCLRVERPDIPLIEDEINFLSHLH